jgi:DNA polymerase III epsilon subunit-like protein
MGRIKNKIWDADSLCNEFLSKHYMIEMGAGKISKRYNTSKSIVYEAKELVKNKLHKQISKKLPKILIFDIETSPSISYTFGRFKYNISFDQVEQEPIMLTWSAKWLYSSDVLSDSITSEEVLRADDKRIVISLWRLFDEADIVVAHFGDNFDIPVLNTRAIINGLPPYNPIRSIDTKKVASGSFKFPSNKLDALAKYFGIEGKIKTEFSLWTRCLKGDKSAINEMQIYNNQDVFVLEEIYLILRPYIKSHPNIAAYIDTDVKVCSVCGSTNLIETEKFQYTNTGKYKLYRCSCGAISRGRRSDIDKTKGKMLLTSVPR